MRLIVKHVNRNAQGVWKYRRRVPGDIVDVIGKTEFKGTLGNSHNQALSAWPKFHAQIEQQIARARMGRTSRPDAVATSARDTFDIAMEQYCQLADGLPDRDGHEDSPLDLRDVIADSILERYPSDPDTGDPVGVPREQTHLVNLLRSSGSAAKPPATLRDALKDYIAEKRGNNGSDATAIASAERSVELVVKALGRDPELVTLTRTDAREARDSMLDRFKVNGRGGSVCLNSYWGFAKWISSLVMPLPGLASAR